YLLIQYNLISGLLPDQNIPINLIVQNILAFSVALIMAMYFPLYFYKAYDLKKLKFYAHGGSLIFLLVPFVIFFLVPYLITKDLELCRKIVVVVPFLYALSFLYSLRRAITIKNEEKKDIIYKNEVIGMYVGVMFWSSLPIIAFFETDLNIILTPIMNFHNGSQVVEVVSTNCGLLVMTVLFIRRSVKQSKDEYTQLQELNEDLLNKVKERTSELELANEQKTNTFINLAHETKTPLTLINNYLQEYSAKYGENEELKVIRSCIGKLTKDIINFFDIERINKGFYFYNHDQITNFSKLLNDNIGLFKQFALKKNIRLSNSIENEVFIKADPQALIRIINNLIENAIKYTKENGSITIILKSENGEINFSIKDNGIGIPMNLHSKIFEPYYQINTEKRNYQGMGMGLSIVRKITDSLSGQIKIVSNPEKQPGTEIIIEFDRYELKGNESLAEFINTEDLFINVERLEAKDEILEDERPTIMMIEDNIGLINYMASKLKVKYNIYVATGGNQALEKLKTITHLDLIISDVMMDNGDGLEFYKEISKQKKYRHIPLIFITAKNTIEDKLEALSLGAVDYIYKPFLIGELISKIDSLLKNIQMQRKALIDTAYRTIMVNESTNEYKNMFEENCIKYNLTSRETEIVKLLAKGNTQKVMADELHISDKTVAKHVQNIFEKAEVNNKVELLNKLGINLSHLNNN
ncbi:MAG: response regulator, partial [Cytophagaceae bacterium]|nr:response regulator [Cytophagaceae bacterium]